MRDEVQTPMMSQYMEIKASHPGCMIFFRLGDFFELFFDDAIEASRILGITLTKRGKEIPMCGVPCANYENYLSRLVLSGKKVALCDQVEEAQKGSKTLVKRAVTRIFTKGTLFEDSLLDPKANNFLLAVHRTDCDYQVIYGDVSTGEIFEENVDDQSIIGCIYKICPKEILVWNNSVYKAISEFDDLITLLDDTFPDAMSAFSQYMKSTQKSIYKEPCVVKNNQYLEIDGSTIKNLEIFQSFDGDVSKSLLKAIDKTVTNVGARMFKQWLTKPLKDVKLINERLDKIEFFLNNPILNDTLRKSLRSMTDIQRIVTRVVINKFNISDLNVLKSGIDIAIEIFRLLNKDYPTISSHDVLIEAVCGDGIKIGFSQELDKLKNFHIEQTQAIASLQKRYIDMLNISSLKIKHNNVLGYHIEVTNIHKHKVPDDFILRQAGVSCLKFSTKELIALETMAVQAQYDAVQLEKNIISEIAQKVAKERDKVIELAYMIGEIDIFSSLAHLARYSNYVRPLIDDSLAFSINGGRHPVIDSSNFIKNDCDLSSQRLWLMTGPNMAGKSTFLRQNALIALMAQIGSFVPADKAHIGVIDKIFSRVGAADDIARGNSTFMVEMKEAALILQKSTHRSLVIMDEIGRGTSTKDGLAIAEAILEHLHDEILCRGIFATHYHEITSCVKRLKGVGCYTMDVMETNDSVVFLYKVTQGVTNKSFGIHVAEMAGIPMKVVQRMREIMNEYDSSGD